MSQHVCAFFPFSSPDCDFTLSAISDRPSPRNVAEPGSRENPIQVDDARTSASAACSTQRCTPAPSLVPATQTPVKSRNRSREESVAETVICSPCAPPNDAKCGCRNSKFVNQIPNLIADKSTELKRMHKENTQFGVRLTREMHQLLVKGMPLEWFGQGIGMTGRVSPSTCNMTREERAQKMLRLKYRQQSCTCSHPLPVHLEDLSLLLQLNKAIEGQMQENACMVRMKVHMEDMEKMFDDTCHTDIDKLRGKLAAVQHGPLFAQQGGMCDPGTSSDDDDPNSNRNFTQARKYPKTHGKFNVTESPTSSDDEKKN
jgi:hypothetical protein